MPQILNVPSSNLFLCYLRPNERQVELLNERQVQLPNESLYAEILVHIYIVVIVVKSVWLFAIANCMSKYFYVGGLSAPPQNP